MKRTPLLAASVLWLLPALALAEPPPHGLTFEAALGVGSVHSSAGGASNDSDPWLAFGVGVGGWLGPGLALTARVAGVDVRQTSTGSIAMASPEADVFFGPSLQWWVTPRLWLAGGIGVAEQFDRAVDDTRGWGLDLRAGYSFALDAVHAVDVSVELTPSYYGGAGGIAVANDGSVHRLDAYTTGIALLAGYHYR